jgi:mono/diheme cytochrome c family protein
MMTLMKLMRVCVLVSLTAMVGGTSAWAGDPRQGERMATRWCAACHVVTSSQNSAFADAPSFWDIARRHSDKKQIENFLITPHPPMPDMHLTRKEIDDITSYIRSLDALPAPAPEDQDDRRQYNG